MFGLGVPEILIILAVIILLFGGKKIPEIARGLAKGIKEFKQVKEGSSPDSSINNNTSNNKSNNDKLN